LTNKVSFWVEDLAPLFIQYQNTFISSGVTDFQEVVCFLGVEISSWSLIYDNFSKAKMLVSLTIKSKSSAVKKNLNKLNGSSKSVFPCPNIYSCFHTNLQVDPEIRVAILVQHTSLTIIF
jgi:hypothetical protein